MNTLSRYRKAIVGGLVAGLTTLGVALADGHVDPVEGVTIALAVIAGSGLVAATKNDPPASGDHSA